MLHNQSAVKLTRLSMGSIFADHILTCRCSSPTPLPLCTQPHPHYRSLYSLYISATNDEREANQLSVGLVFPFLLISGIIWPLQAMPQWLQAISRCLPLTLAVNGLRYVIHWVAPAITLSCVTNSRLFHCRMVVGRGWDMTYYEVWSGFSIAAGWAVGFLILSVIFAKFKRAWPIVYLLTKMCKYY